MANRIRSFLLSFTMITLVAVLVFGTSANIFAATAWSEEVTVITPPDSVSPAAPTGLVATDGNQKVDLDWDDNTEDDIDYYTVYRKPQGGVYASVATPTASQYEDLDVQWGTTYTYKVTATDLSGNPESADSNEDNATPYCSTDPVQIDDADPSITYNGTWNANNWPDRLNGTIHESDQAGAEMVYTFIGDSIELLAEDSQYGGSAEVYIDDQLDATISYVGDHPPYGISKYAKSGLPNAQHTMKLVVVSGWCYVDALVTTTPCEQPCPDKAPQSAPADVLATAVSHEEISLTWTDTSSSDPGQCDKADAFIIERKTTGDFAVLATVGDVASYDDTCLEHSTSYTYRVTASNSFGESPASSEASATTDGPPAPAAPTNVACLAGADTNTLTWEYVPVPSCNPLPDVLYYMVYRSTTQGGPYTPVAVAFGGTNIVDSQVYSDTTYYYVLKSVDVTAGISEYSGEVHGMPHTPELPAAPSDLVATAVSASQIDLSWTDNSDNEDGFRVYRDGDMAGETTGTTYNDTGLQASTTYNYKVVAYNVDGESAEPNPTDSATTDSIPAPNAPSDLVATAVSGSQIDLTWTDNSDNEDNFIVYRDSVEVGTPTAASFSDTGLNPLTTYSYTVTAVNAGGESAAAGPVSETTLGGTIIEDYVDDADASITYTGTWGAQTGWGGRYQTTIHESEDSGTPAAAEMEFTGVEISLIADTQPYAGSIDVYIDDQLELDNVSLNAATAYQVEIFKLTVPNGTHTVKIENQGGGWIYVDAFIVGHY